MKSSAKNTDKDPMAVIIEGTRGTVRSYSFGAIARLNSAGVLDGRLTISSAGRPYDAARGLSRPRMLIYRAGGDDFKNVQGILTVFPGIGEVVMVDLGYTGEFREGYRLLADRNIDFRDGLSIRFYNFRHLRNVLAREFELIEELVEDPNRSGRYSVLVGYLGKPIRMHFIRADARTERGGLGVASSATISFINLPGYFGILPRNPDFIKALASDLAPGELLLAEKAEINLPAVLSAGFRIIAASTVVPTIERSLLFDDGHFLDLTAQGCWCIFRKI
jgi:hypothetical protein